MASPSAAKRKNGGRAQGASGAWADRYRQRWTWDGVTWGSHSVDCYPGGCPWRVFTKDGRIVREEQSGSLPPVEAGIPDMNPMGCQKGACWSHCHYSQDRVTHPLKRVGERGEGKFEEVSWDEALGDIADGMLDAIVEEGPASVVTLFTPEPGAAPARLFSDVLGLPTTDGNAEFQDFSPGWHLTWGLYNPVSTMDDWFLADLTLIWHANPVYTNIHWYHYVAESRYNGGEVVTIAPDFSPSSAVHADYHVPVRIGTDAALALAMCKVIIDAESVQEAVRAGADRPAAAGAQGHGRFLRGSRRGGYEGERRRISSSGGIRAPGRWRPRRAARWRPPASIRRSRARFGHAQGRQHGGGGAGPSRGCAATWRSYTPEKAGEICEIHPDNIRKLARKVATRRTKIFIGWNSGKYYHGDLMERSMALLLGLTGNWGKKGTGTRSWAIMGYDGEAFMSAKEGPARRRRRS